MMIDSTAVITTIITALVTIFTVIVNSKATENRISAELKINQAVTEEKIKTLTAEVQKHNGFAEQIPVIKEQIKVVNHRIEDLEHNMHAGEHSN